MVVSFSDSLFSIHHGDDPLLYAYNITNEDLTKFPLGSSFSRMSTNYLAFGSTGIGLLIAILSFGTCIVLCSIPKYRKEYIFVNITEEHEFLLNIAESKQNSRDSVALFSFPSPSIDDESAFGNENKNL